MGRTDLGDSLETSEKSQNDSIGKSVPHVGGSSDSERTISIDSERTVSGSFGDIPRDEEVSSDGWPFVSGAPTDLSGRYKTPKYIASDGQRDRMAVKSRHARVNQDARSRAEEANTDIARSRSLEEPKNDLLLPQWFKDLVKNSNVTGIDGWTHYEIIRKDVSSKDKVPDSMREAQFSRELRE
ncbi:hypothetical protein EJB05_44243, partial [Eragrostis curvula]